jgi:hypothetical protein
MASGFPILNRVLLHSQRNTMVYRVPDDAGIWWSSYGRVGLALRRLAIVGLPPTGPQQPLDDSGYSLVSTITLFCGPGADGLFEMPVSMNSGDLKGTSVHRGPSCI